MRLAYLTGLFLIASSLIGCSSDKKMESVCVDLLKSFDSDPSNLKINGVKINKGSLKEVDINDFYKEKWGSKKTDSAEEMRKIRIKEKDQSSQYFINLDYTTKNKLGGPLRDVAICRYFQWEDKSIEFASFTVNNIDYGQEKISRKFLFDGRPSGLDSSYKLN